MKASHYNSAIVTLRMSIFFGRKRYTYKLIINDIAIILSNLFNNCKILMIIIWAIFIKLLDIHFYEYSHFDKPKILCILNFKPLFFFIFLHNLVKYIDTFLTFRHITSTYKSQHDFVSIKLIYFYNRIAFTRFRNNK